MQTISDLTRQADGPGLAAYLEGLSDAELTSARFALDSALTSVEQEQAARRDRTTEAV